MTDSSSEHFARMEMAAWTSGDFETVRTLVADDVSFVGAMGTTAGADEYIAGLRGLTEIVTGVDIQRVISDDDDVCVIYTLNTTSAGGLPCAAWYRFRDSKIASKQVFFDPRPIVPT